MPVHAAVPPARLYRVARAPDPLAWPPLEYSGGGRFDDERRGFSVLYAAEQPEACFVEVLAPFRPSVETLARINAPTKDADFTRRLGTIGSDWCRSRLQAAFSIVDGQRCRRPTMA